MNRRWQSAIAGLAIATATIAALAQTVGDLRKKSPPVVVGPAAPVDAAKVREAYRRFLELNAGDPQMRAEALRRLADLELESADAERADGTTPMAGGAETRAAIALYERLLAEAPDHPRIDSVLYQLGRAWEAEGDPERALSYLDRLVANFPSSTHIEEAQFRRGEILFSARRWPEAESAYESVIRRGSGTAFEEQALYKHGWALFKQSRTEESSKSFLAVLDRKLLSSPGVEIESMDKLSRADRELVEDTMRVLGIQFAADDPAGALSAALAEHGSPSYSWRLHGSLGDLLVEKERYTDAADTYRAYAAQHPGDAHSPVLQGRAIEAYLKGGFAELALQGKREYVELYAFDGPFWATRTRESAPEVVAQLKANLRDLAQHHHALAQKDHKAADYQQAARWYRDLLKSFPDEPDTADTNYLLADLLFESGQFRDAAIEYERTAYERPRGPRSGTAAYSSLLAYDRQAESLKGTELEAWRAQSIEGELKFASTFPEHAEAPAVQVRAMQQLYDRKDYERAIVEAGKVLTWLPPMTMDRERLALNITADAEFELAHFDRAEAAYSRLQPMVAPGDKARTAIDERLAASIYKQAEAKQAAGDANGAVDDFLRIAARAPNASIRVNAEYDAGALLLREKQWPRAIEVLEAFRRDHPTSPLAADVPRRLAGAYIEAGRPLEAAVELERIADTATESAELRRQALEQAAELNEKAGHPERAAVNWANFVQRYPEPVAPAIEARQKLADFAASSHDATGRQRWLKEIVTADASAGSDRTDRTRYLAATASLELATPVRDAFYAIRLTAPLKDSLAAKKAAMETAVQAYTATADYAVAEVTTAATFELAELYRRLGKDLLESERPAGLDEDSLEQYVTLLEEQAYPFEEKAIEIHAINAARTGSGVYDDWVRKSFAALAALVPARYGKTEVIGDYVVSIAPAAPAIPEPAPVPAPVTGAAGAAATVVAPPPPDPAIELPLQAAGKLVAEERLDDAAAIWTELATRMPTHAAAGYNLGLLAMRRGQWPQALEQLEVARPRAPADAAILDALGITYRNLGRFRDAEAVYRSSLEAAPDRAATHRNIGVLLDLYLQQPAEALPHFEQYLALTGAADKQVSGWIAELRQRVAPAAQSAGVLP
jgi:tetratricopeptide (TPR) repeat protein